MKNENTRTVFNHCHVYKCLQSTSKHIHRLVKNRQCLLPLQDNKVYCLALLLGTWNTVQVEVLEFMSINETEDQQRKEAAEEPSTK